MLQPVNVRADTAIYAHIRCSQSIWLLRSIDMLDRSKQGGLIFNVAKMEDIVGMSPCVAHPTGPGYVEW